MSPNPDIHSILKASNAFITYVPLRPEVPWEAILSLPTGPTYRIEPRASLDPLAEALHAMKTVGSLSAVILIPGRRFDALGTRHGQGGGWYDRFLARVPASWTRIGFCYEDQFSETALRREAWDEPMDYVTIMPRDGTSYRLCETRARL